LDELLTKRGVVLCHLYNRVVFIHGEALVGNRLLHGVVCLVGDVLLIGRRRPRNLLFVALLDAGYLLYGRRSRIQLLVRDSRRW
jgi:hypothetical protein